MAIHFCKKCGRRIPDDCSEKYCDECRKKHKKIRSIIKYSLIVTVTAAGAVYVWESQPEYVRRMVKKTVAKKVEKARSKLAEKASELESQGKAMIAESKNAIDLKEKGRKLLSKSKAITKELEKKPADIHLSFNGIK